MPSKSWMSRQFETRRRIEGQERPRAAHGTQEKPFRKKIPNEDETSRLLAFDAADTTVGRDACDTRRAAARTWRDFS